MTMSALFELFVALLGGIYLLPCLRLLSIYQGRSSSLSSPQPARLRRVFAFGEIYYIMKLIKIEECLYV